MFRKWSTLQPTAVAQAAHTKKKQNHSSKQTAAKKKKKRKTFEEGYIKKRSRQSGAQGALQTAHCTWQIARGTRHSCDTLLPIQHPV